MTDVKKKLKGLTMLKMKYAYYIKDRLKIRLPSFQLHPYEITMLKTMLYSIFSMKLLTIVGSHLFPVFK